MHNGVSRKDRHGKILGILGVALTLTSTGYFALSPDPSLVFGCGLVFIGCFLIVIALWDVVEWPLTRKLSVALLFLALVAVGDYYWGTYVTRPSFTYVVPGVVINTNAWDFIVAHKGPKSSHSVEILFRDQDAMREVLKNITDRAGNKGSHFSRYGAEPVIQ
jgi:hypothetical protein